ncbi:MAG: flavodoxin family protein [bacterium]
MLKLEPVQQCKISPPKIVLINASHRRNGNTSLAIKSALDGVMQKGGIVNLINLVDENINHCDACNHCKGLCIYDDAMTKIGQMLIDSDGLIVATPVYFGGITSLLKVFIERTRIYRHNNFSFANKVFGAISVAGRRNGGQETAIIELYIAFVRHGMIIVNNGQGTSQYGGTVWAGSSGEANHDHWGLLTCQNVGIRVTEIARLIKAGKFILNYNPEYYFSEKEGTTKEMWSEA